MFIKMYIYRLYNIYYIIRKELESRVKTSHSLI